MMKISKTNEQALEQAIELALTGYNLEDAIEDISINPMHDERQMYNLEGNGFYVGYATDFNPTFAIDEVRFFSFLSKTQAEELEKLKRHADWRQRILTRFDRMIRKNGVISLLRKGLKVESAHFTLLYQAPMASSSEAVKANFEKNEFSVTRQVQYNLNNRLEEIDMVIFVNGVPIITMELKNAWTGQTAALHGIQQYMRQRDNKQPLLQFGRCIVHFAVDTDEVYMCTKLNGEKSFFLPFNKGNNNGKGNPVNPDGHRTAYLWEEVLTKRSIANIIQHFVRFDGKANDSLNSRTLFFPRYHQMDVVRKLIDHATQNGVGHTYLIQHSAGSGKSNSITWAAFQLIETYPEREDLPGAKAMDKPLFDSVIVVTDRRLLDKQLRDNIKEFSQVKNIVAPALNSQQLKQNLEQGKKIIITTIQKFPFIIDGIADLSDRRFAVIIDEAHSSQGGIAADKLNVALGTEEAEDVQDIVLKAILERKMRTNNASYYAFTATPKNSTLEKFGAKQTDGSFKPFHLYSMKQAIEEGFILDVLANYTTYKSYYEIQKSIEDNPIFDTKRAQGKLRAYVERNKQTINTKAEIMLEHFVNNVYYNSKRLKGKGKAMVVTQNIETAIRYYTAIKNDLEARGNPFKVLVAFSGNKMVDGIEHTEASINGFADTKTRDMFDEDEYRILVVANKYLTGFDQKKLCAMYVDKRLQGVLAVQALSRLNRSANELGKRTEDIFVLDFFNNVDDIKDSFDPFYTSTSLSGETDVNVLHDLMDYLDDVGVYEVAEIDDFVDKYFRGADAQLLSPIIDTAANRFENELDLEDDDKADFKIKAKQFVKIYGQVAAIIPFENVEWEKHFWFLKFLIPKLKVRNAEDEMIDELLESVDLSTYGIERTKLGHSIGLDDSNTELDPQNPNPRGVHSSEEERDLLDEIIRAFNERWYEGWEETEEERRVKFVSLFNNVHKHEDFELQVMDNKDAHTRSLALEKIMSDVFLRRRKANVEEYRMWAQDDGFRKAMMDAMERMITNMPRGV